MSNDNNLKNTNPKDLIGSDKLPLHLFPMSVVAYGCIALLDGALKYGRSNWREAGVRASIYYDACLRHMSRWFEGEELDSDSGIPHLAHALACIAIIIDAKEANNLKDDRMYPANYEETLKHMTHYVKVLKERHKDKKPKHWTIEDKKEETDVRPWIIKGICTNRAIENNSICDLGYACDTCPYNKEIK